MKFSDLHYMFKDYSIQLLFYYCNGETRFAAEQDLEQLKTKFNQIIKKTTNSYINM